MSNSVSYKPLDFIDNLPFDANGNPILFNNFPAYEDIPEDVKLDFNKLNVYNSTVYSKLEVLEEKQFYKVEVVCTLDNLKIITLNLKKMVEFYRKLKTLDQISCYDAFRNYIIQNVLIHLRMSTCNFFVQEFYGNGFNQYKKTVLNIFINFIDRLNIEECLIENIYIVDDPSLYPQSIKDILFISNANLLDSNV